MTDVLVCNAGSTSLKFALYRFPEAQRVFGMKIGGIGRRDAEVFCRREDTAHRYCFFSDVQDYRAGVELFFATLAEEGIAVSSPLLVGFKTVFAQGYHGTQGVSRRHPHVPQHVSLRRARRGVRDGISHDHLGRKARIPPSL